jgi:hypothetical protein
VCSNCSTILLFYFNFYFLLLSGEVLGAVCARLGPDIYGKSKDKILEGIRSNLERQPLSEAGQMEQEDMDKLVEKLSSSPSSPCRVGSVYIELCYKLHD